MIGFDPFRIWANGVAMSMMLAEAQVVIAMRCLGMAGVWSVTRSENRRMVSEKAYAMTRSATRASQAILAGKPADAVAAAALDPIRRATRANARRLGKRGPQRRI